MPDDSRTAYGSGENRFTIPSSLLRREIRIGAVARAYLFAADGQDHDATNIHGSITADIVHRLGLLADEAFAVLPLTLRRSRPNCASSMGPCHTDTTSSGRPRRLSTACVSVTSRSRS